VLNIHLSQVLYRGFWKALDWIYPPVCAGCGEPGYRLCPNCLHGIRFLDGKVCERCGIPVKEKVQFCPVCKQDPPPYTALRSLARYEGIIRDCVHALKYDGNQSLGEYFAELLVQIVRAEKWDPEVIIPVPLSPARLAERGYNQSALLARPIALQLGVRFNPFGLRRVRNTRSQVELTAEQRRENVRGAFTAIPDIVSNKRILLVDDVTTTGSTIRECAKALTTGGATAIYCLTLARPIHSDSLSPLESPSSII
jgi:competence protein ComFC